MAEQVKKDASGEEEEEDEDEEEEENEDEESEGKVLLYDEKEFADLDVGPEMRQVFSFIGLYTPRVIELEFELKPFIPDFMPAVGDIDAFIKVSVGADGTHSLLVTIDMRQPPAPAPPDSLSP